MIYRALIPVKNLEGAKSRLAAHLSLEQRKALVLDMLSHVVHTLRGSGLLERVSVVSPDPRVLALAQAWGAYPMPEEQPGHNPALQAAAIHERVDGTTALLTISADLPLLRPSDIQQMLAQSMHYNVVLAPSQDGTGTNAILVRPPLALPYVFGPGSLQHYLAEARQHALRSTLYTSSSLALDIDTIEDLEMYWRYEIEGKAAHASYY